MPSARETYTYQSGNRLDLTWDPSCFISRATQRKLHNAHFHPIELVSPHSWSVRTSSDQLDEDVRRARSLAPAYRAYAIAATGTKFLITDRIFVRFKYTVTNDEANQFAADTNLVLLTRLSPRDCLFRVPQEYDVVDVVRRLTECKPIEVDSVDHDLNIQVHQQSHAVSTGTRVRQWHLLTRSRSSRISRLAPIDCVRAWQLRGYGNRDVVIAVVDAGFELNDPNFSSDKFAGFAVLRDGELVGSEQFRYRAQDVLNSPITPHGTKCATLAAADMNFHGGLGVAPNCRLLPVKWQDTITSFSQSQFLALIEYLRPRADVVINSWNVPQFVEWPDWVHDALEDAAESGGPSGNGMVWVWSAGNNNCPIVYEGNVPVPIRMQQHGSGLAVAESSNRFRNPFVEIDGIVHVGAVSSFGKRCHYSNYGHGLDLVAPSGNYHSYGRGEAAGIDILAPFRHNRLDSFTGTSAAAPLVGGVAALLRSANPDLTSKCIVSIMKRTADRDLDLTGYERSSDRGIDPDPDWDVSPVAPFDSGEFEDRGHAEGPWSPWFGFGKVNAYKAVRAALNGGCS